jgi:hypothetical protein
VNLEIASSGSSTKLRKRAKGFSALSLSVGVLGLIGLVANYLQFEQAGRTDLFWLLFALAVLLAVMSSCVLVVRWWRNRLARAEIRNRHEKIAFLLELRDDLRDCENAKALSEQIGPRAKIVSIQQQEGVVTAILSIGKKEKLKVSTPLLVYRVDNQTPEGLRVEQPIGLLRVSYVQAGNNLSHAEVVVSPKAK